MKLTEDHLRATYGIYMNYGNSSSATILSVMNRLRSSADGRDNVVALAFGPGISLEMMILRRRRRKDAHAHDDLNGSSLTNGFHGPTGHEEADDGVGRAQTNGHAPKGELDALLAEDVD